MPAPYEPEPPTEASKLKRPRTPRTPKVEPWVKRHEKTISAVSGIATAIGVLFAALSSFLAWQQIEVSNRERMTPYKSILFSSKLAAYQSIVAADRKFIEKALLQNSAVSNPLHDALIQALDGQKYGTRVAAEKAAREREKIRDAVEGAYSDYVSALTQNKPIWPEEIILRIEAVGLEASRVNSCLNTVATLGADLKVTIDGNTSQPCARDTRNAAIDRLIDLTRELERAMQADLRTDKLQAITND